MRFGATAKTATCSTFAAVYVRCSMPDQRSHPNGRAFAPLAAAVAHVWLVWRTVLIAIGALCDAISYV
jgi:hypothetical protein